MTRALRRARLLAARKAGRGFTRFAIMRGYYDNGDIVKRWMVEE